MMKWCVVHRACVKNVMKIKHFIIPRNIAKSNVQFNYFILDSLIFYIFAKVDYYCKTKIILNLFNAHEVQVIILRCWGYSNEHIRTGHNTLSFCGRWATGSICKSLVRTLPG